jgi:ArsR family transcriptional regulator
MVHMGNRPQSPPLASLFAALADTTRLRLLNLMAGREVCVCYLVEILRQGQPKISRHLAYLRKTGVVAARRDGKWMHYRICPPSDPAQASILHAVLASLRSDRQMQRDLAKLESVCCARPEPSSSNGSSSNEMSRPTRLTSPSRI